MDLDKEHKKDALFVEILLHTAVDSHYNIIEEPELDIVKDLPSLYNNIANISVFEVWITSMRNRALISVLFLVMLCYA